MLVMHNINEDMNNKLLFNLIQGWRYLSLSSHSKLENCSKDCQYSEVQTLPVASLARHSGKMK